MSTDNRPWLTLVTALLALGLVAGLGVGAIALEKPTGEVSGTVYSAATGKPLANAEVTVSGPVNRHVQSAEDGTFHFYHLPVGSYYDAVRHRRYDAQYQEGQTVVKEGQKVEGLTFKLARTTPTLNINNTQRVFTPKDTVRITASGTATAGIDVVLYKVDLAKALAQDSELKLLHHPDVAALQRDGLVTEQRRWRQPVPREIISDDDTFYKPVQIDGNAEGNYVVQMTTVPEATPEDTEAPLPLQASYWYNVSHVGLVAKRDAGQLMVYATDLVTKRPLSGATIKAFDDRHHPVQATTNADGLATLAAPTGNHPWVMADAQGATALTAAGWNGEDAGYRIYAYSERPVYRPGQQVFLKAMVRAQHEARYSLAAGKVGTYKVVDPTGVTVGTDSFVLDKDGAWDGKVALAPDAALGEYDVEFSLNKVFETMRFKVADYRKPEYKVEISSDKPRYVQGGKAKVHMLASYYFGAPVPHAKLNVTVYAAPKYAERDPDEYFYTNFDDSEGSIWGFGDVVQQTEATTDDQGKLDLEVPLPVAGAEGASDGWYGDHVYTVSVEAVDASGRPVKGRSGFSVSQGDLKLDVRSAQYLVMDKHPIQLELGAHDYDGKGAAADVQVTLTRLESARKTDKEGNDTWETVRKPAWSGSAKTDAQGMGHLTVPAQPAGDYEIRAQLTDAAGHTVVAMSGAWVASEGDGAMAGDDGGSGSIKLVFDKKVYKPGDTARVLAIAPVPDLPAWVTIEGVKLHESRLVRFKGTHALIRVPITTAFEPNAFVAVTIANGRELLEASKSLNVLPAEKFLKLVVKSDKPRYEPGDKATYTVEARDAAGRPVEADVSLGVVDEAVYAIEPETTPDIRYFFHGPHWNQITTSYSFADDYSGGLDKFAPDPRVRAHFEDTAGWFPNLHTGKDGKASVSLTLPDNLTTWVATARAITADTRVGSANSTALATKNLLVRLETPRFAVEGDKILVSAIAHSYLDKLQQVSLTLALEGLTTSAPLTQSVAIEPGDAKRVTWQVDAPGVRDVKVRITARSQVAGDAMELGFPVQAFAMPDFQAFGGSADTTKPGYASVEVPANAVPDSLKLSLQLHVTPLPTILGAVDYLQGYAYGCVEQTMTRIFPAIALKPRLDAAHAPYGKRFDDAPARVKEGLRRIAGLQHGDGGWGWWEHDDTQVEMTAYALHGLAQAKAAGYPVAQPMVKRGLDNLQRALPRIGKDRFTRDSVRRGAGADTRAFALFALADWDAVPAKELERLWSDREDLSTFGWAQFALVLGHQHDTRRFGALEALRDHRDESGAQVHWNANAQEYAWQDSSTEATAYALQALLAIAPDDPLVPKAVRWLESKNARGYWESTKDTGAAAVALADELRLHPGQHPPSQTVVVSVDHKEVLRKTADWASADPADMVLQLPGTGLSAGGHPLELAVDQGTMDFSGGLAFSRRADKAAASPGQGGLQVQRSYFLLPAKLDAAVKGRGRFGQFYEDTEVAKLQPITGHVKAGERVLVRETLTNAKPLRYMAFEDPLPAGCEVLDDQPDGWGFWWDHVEYRDDRVAFFFHALAPGKHDLYYVMRPTTPGTFHVIPATAWAMYAPDVRARSAGSELVIDE